MKEKIEIWFVPTVGSLVLVAEIFIIFSNNNKEEQLRNYMLFVSVVPFLTIFIAHIAKDMIIAILERNNKYLVGIKWKNDLHYEHINVSDWKFNAGLLELTINKKHKKTIVLDKTDTTYIDINKDFVFCYMDGKIEEYKPCL